MVMSEKRVNHILIIEDDPAVGKSLSTGLKQEGFQTTWKVTGKEGLSFIKENMPDLVLLDVRLPDGSGFDFCRQIRTHGFQQPVIMLTVQREETDKVLGLEMGADDYVTKPFSLRELISRIRANLRRAYGELSTGDSNLMYIGDLIIDQSRALVKRGEQIIYLTPIEFRLLVLLGRHPDQVLSRTQIVDGVWGHLTSVENEKTVNVHIRRLREKVEIDPGKPILILTVPGMGYRFSDRGK